VADRIGCALAPRLVVLASLVPARNGRTTGAAPSRKFLSNYALPLKGSRFEGCVRAASSRRVSISRRRTRERHHADVDLQRAASGAEVIAQRLAGGALPGRAGFRDQVHRPFGDPLDRVRPRRELVALIGRVGVDHLDDRAV